MTRNEFVNSWIAALNSGDYRQARDRLVKGRKNPSYCCLGVACVVSNNNGYVGGIDIYDNDLHEGGLPIPLAKKLNVTVSGSFIEHVEHNGVSFTSLIDLNDYGQARFKTIARVIREQWDAKNFLPYP